MILENIEGTLTLLPSKMKYHSMSLCGVRLPLLADGKAWYRFMNTTYMNTFTFSPQSVWHGM